MKKNILVIFSALLLQLNLFSQKSRNVVSLSMGMNIKIENSAYIDFDNPDFEIWIDPETHAVFNLSYNYRLNETLQIGVNMEHEKLNLESFYTDEIAVNRNSFGFQFLAWFPKTPLHAELGGFGNLGHIGSDDFDNSLWGIENGIIAGPGYQIGQIDISVQFQSCFGYYFLPSNEAPASSLIMYPRLYLKIGYLF